jgi:hypothetical protein
MPRLTLVAALMALCLLVPRLPAQPAGGLPAPDALPAPEAPAEEAAPPWTVEQAAEALATIEGALDPQRHGYVRSQYYDHGSGRIELCGFVASPDDLATAKSAVEGAMGVVNVDVTNVVIVGESPRRPESALKKVVSYLQDGRHYDDIRDESRAMIASPDPRMRAAGLVFSSISYLEEKDPIRGCGYLRVASQVDPVLLDSDQLRGFFAYDQFSDLMRMPDETWNTDIVNPYFVPASKLPSFLRSVESLTALASLVVVPPPPPEPLPPPQPGMPAPSIAAAPGELPPADLPADVAPAPGAPSAAPGDLPAGPPSATPGTAEERLMRRDPATDLTAAAARAAVRLGAESPAAAPGEARLTAGPPASSARRPIRRSTGLSAGMARPGPARARGVPATVRGIPMPSGCRRTGTCRCRCPITPADPTNRSPCRPGWVLARTCGPLGGGDCVPRPKLQIDRVFGYSRFSARPLGRVSGMVRYPR